LNVINYMVSEHDFGVTSDNFVVMKYIHIKEIKLYRSGSIIILLSYDLSHLKTSSFGYKKT